MSRHAENNRDTGRGQAPQFLTPRRFVRYSAIAMHKWTTADIPSLAGTLSVVTGANSGIGWYAALELARAGSEVILAARSEAKGRDAADRILRDAPMARVRPAILDLASLASVRAFAAGVDREPRLDLLVNNAGVMLVPTRQTTSDGFELQFGTNVLGPFALTALLMPALRRAPLPRVTTVSSGAANMGTRRIRFEDLQWVEGYAAWKVYCQTKLADLMFALELGRRCTAARVSLTSTAAHPGYARTNLQTSGPGRPLNLTEKVFEKLLSQDAFHGALATLRAATDLDATSGSYYGPDGVFQMRGNPVPIPIPKPGQNEDAARRLWDVATRLTGVTWSLS
jgi:NAD(P)-dependent dehydrogenase (short-subunit alcohol dehydrogenase family)